MTLFTEHKTTPPPTVQVSAQKGAGGRAGREVWEVVGGLRDGKVGRREGEEGGFNTVKCSFLVTIFNGLFYSPN